MLLCQSMKFPVLTLLDTSPHRALWTHIIPHQCNSCPGSLTSSASRGTVLWVYPGMMIPPRFPTSTPPYRSANSAGSGRSLGGETHSRSKCRFLSDSGCDSGPPTRNDVSMDRRYQSRNRKRIRKKRKKGQKFDVIQSKCFAWNTSCDVKPSASFLTLNQDTSRSLPPHCVTSSHQDISDVWRHHYPTSLPTHPPVFVVSPGVHDLVVV